MRFNSRYKRTSNFTSGHSGYEDPNDKEAPIWMTLVLVLAVLGGVLGLLIGSVVLFGAH